MNKDLLDKEKKLLAPHKEVFDHHALLVNHHFQSFDLHNANDNQDIKTAFPTPNDFYMQQISSLIKEKKDEKGPERRFE